MKNLKKVLALLLVLVFTFSLVGCGNDTNGGDAQQPSDGEGEPGGGAGEGDGQGASAGGTYELALITDVGDIDDQSFNQFSYEGVKKYGDENGVTYKYYKPAEGTTDACVAAIDLAVKGGAKLIVTPGFLFEAAIYQAQDLYPDVKFVFVDGTPQNGDYTDFRQEDNVYCILYAEEQSGFLAGYACVKDGYRNFGFMGGMAVPAVVRFGYGFVQGADKAAQELGLKQGDIKVNYHYTGAFEATPEVQAMAASWYENGTEVIFGCGGSVGLSVFAAAEQAGKYSVGVDNDQSNLSETIITSCAKGLTVSVYDAIEKFYAGEFPGGTVATMDASNGGVQLPMANSRFKTFSQEDYDALFDKLVNDTDGLASSIKKDTDAEKVTDLELAIAEVTLIE